MSLTTVSPRHPSQPPPLQHRTRLRLDLWRPRVRRRTRRRKKRRRRRRPQSRARRRRLHQTRPVSLSHKRRARLSLRRTNLHHLHINNLLMSAILHNSLDPRENLWDPLWDPKESQ